MTLTNVFKVRSIACTAIVLLACAAAEAQVGPGTTGRIAKFDSPNSVGDSVIAEDKYGNVGLGTNVPTSKFTVAGMIESTTGGFKFPDGSVQTSALADPVLSAFQAELNIHWEDGEIGGSDTLDIPAGKRLVIENLTLRATTGNGGHFGTCDLTTRVNGVQVSHQLIPTFIRSGVSADLYGFQNQVKIYADGSLAPGDVTEISLQASRGGTQIIGNMSLTISGYLVDLPQAAKEANDANKLAAVRIPKGISLKKRR